MKNKKYSLYSNNIDDLEDIENQNDNFIPKEYLKASDKIGSHIDNCCHNKFNLRNYIEGEECAKCWKCGGYNIIKDGWKIIECHNCHELCEIPNLNKNSKIKSAQEFLGLKNEKKGGLVIPRYTGLVCPICKYENKCSIDLDNIKCMACNNVWRVLKPDENPPEKYCDSVDANSHYYKFKPQFRKEPQYPPFNCIGISDMFFPDPVLYHEGAPYPINPYADYALPYQQNIFIKYNQEMKKIKNKNNKFKNIPEKDKNNFIKEAENIIKKIDNSIKINNYSAYTTKSNPDIRFLNNSNENLNTNLNNLNIKSKTPNSGINMLKNNINKKENEKSNLVKQLFFI